MGKQELHFATEFFGYEDYLDVAFYKEDWAKFPTVKHDGDAGFDLYTSGDKIQIKYNSIRPKSWNYFQMIEIHTGTFVELPKGFYGKVENRSGLVSKFPFRVTAGVIDTNYTGEIVVLMDTNGYNSSEISDDLKKYADNGNAIAQLIIMPYLYLYVNEDKKRESDGFGSTDVK